MPLYSIREPKNSKLSKNLEKTAYETLFLKYST